MEPEPATDDDVRLVHDAEYVTKLRNGTLSYQDILRLEIPYSRQMVEAFWLAAGGSILAARQAMEDGIGFNLGGGFHHAFPGHGEGFCAINDVAIAVRRLQADGRIKRAMVVDVDVHHGNGTAAVFADDSSVFTLSIHQFNNYPSEKPLSSLDIHLPDGTGDAEYLHRLGNGYRAAMSMFHPELLVYVAGADPYCGRPAGRTHADVRRVDGARPPGAAHRSGAAYSGGDRAGRRVCAERGRHHHHSREYGGGGEGCPGEGRRTRRMERLALALSLRINVPGVYISYPFCAQKCTYCNFASGVFPRDLEARYLDALAREIGAHAWEWTPDTVYLGGGTPGNLGPDALRALLDLIPGRPWAEATLEAAPGSITPETARAWVAAGINRVSSRRAVLRRDANFAAPAASTPRRIVAAEIAILRAAGIATSIST